MGIRTRCELSGRNMSAMMVQLVKWEYEPAESQKWQEHVNHDCTAHEI